MSNKELTLILTIICQCDVKYIMMLLIKTIMSVLKVSTYIITSTTARPIRLAEILAIICVDFHTCHYSIYIVELVVSSTYYIIRC